VPQTELAKAFRVGLGGDGNWFDFDGTWANVSQVIQVSSSAYDLLDLRIVLKLDFLFLNSTPSTTMLTY
jgi:hypothetical protein